MFSCKDSFILFKIIQKTDVIFNFKGLELMCNCNFTFIVFLFSVTESCWKVMHV